MNIFEAVKVGAEEFFEPLPTRRPTVHPPGSPGKLAVLATRIENGENLWHPTDATDFENSHERTLNLFRRRVK